MLVSKKVLLCFISWYNTYNNTILTCIGVSIAGDLNAGTGITTREVFSKDGMEDLSNFKMITMDEIKSKFSPQSPRTKQNHVGGEN